MIRSMFLLAASAALLGNTAPADTAAQLTECQLGYRQALAAADKLVALRTRPGDLIAAEKDEVTEYGTRGLSALGAEPTSFILNDIINNGEERHIFRTTLAMPYPQARAALLARLGKESCDKDNTGIIKSCFFELTRDAASNFDVTLSVMQVNREESQLYCKYHRKI